MRRKLPLKINEIVKTKKLTRFFTKSKEEIGIPPEELIFRGEKRIDEVLLRVIDFDENYYHEETLDNVQEVSKYSKRDTVTWFNIDGVHDTKIMEDIATEFNLDHLVLADVMETNARPTVKEYENCIFVSIKMPQKDPNSDVNFENLSLVLTQTTLLSFQEYKGDLFEPIRERIRKNKKRIRGGKTDYLLFSMLDIIIDNYLYVISALGEKIEALEDALMVNHNQEIIHVINSYKRELNFFRKNIKPAKEMIFSLAKLESELFNESTDIHFKELQDNIQHAGEATDSYSEILYDELNIYHITVSSKLNDIIKFLTVFSVIFIPLTFIVGVYGTNFDNLPELHYKYSYFIMLGVIFLIATGMLLYFKNKKWL